MEYRDNIMKYTKRNSFNIKYKKYQDYKPQLRTLFNHSCCYCTIFEGENKIGFFHVEHFKPKSKFPILECTYGNLLYACHKCNVYKKDYWIDDSYDCIKNCNKCKNNLCREKDLYRFIDPCYENPNDYIEEKEFVLVEKNNSKIGKYTIELLRLNRKQLLKLRQARRSLFMWLEEQYDRKEKAEVRLNKSKTQLDRLEKILNNPAIGEYEKLALQALNYTLNKQIAIYQLEIVNTDKDIEKISEILYDTRKRTDSL